MIIISDTTPIISLLKINRLELLQSLYGEVIVPSAVYEELTTNPKFQTEAEAIKKSAFIVSKQATRNSVSRSLSTLRGSYA